MSHLPERKENDCLNCGAVVHGRFCHVCGQENIEPKESFWHLLTHFVYDVTHFDGKFFSTLKYLLFKPGFLSKEYLRGRRASYLHPIRMYVFTSAFFFLIFFTVNKDNEVEFKEKKVTAAGQMTRLEKRKKRLSDVLADTTVPDLAKKPTLRALETVDSDIVRLQRDTMYKTKIASLKDGADFNNNFNVFRNTEDSAIKTVEQYDEHQAKLAEKDRDGFVKKAFTRRSLYLNEKYNGDGKKIWSAIIEKFKHLVPQMLFVSLPLFALMMQLLYIRRKNFYYVNHVVFTIHLYCGTFIIILAGMLVDYIAKKLLHYDGGLDGLIVTLGCFIYWYKSMRNFYQQRRAKTILKYILVMLISIIFMSLLFALFFMFSAMAA